MSPNHENPFYSTMTVGFKKDNEIKTEQIELFKYGNVYFPDNDYYNSDCLPTEWLELFEDPNNLDANQGKISNFEFAIEEDEELDKYEEKLRKEQRETDPVFKEITLNRRQSVEYANPNSRRNSIFESVSI